MGRLPQELPWHDADNKWASILEPLLAKPIVNGQLLININLVVGTNVINHKLQRKLQGYIIVGNSAASTIYDTQATNQMPELTLNLISNAVTTIALWVF